MEIRNLYTPVEIEFKNSDECPLKTQKYTFFELAYIMSGEGYIHINNNKYPYVSNNMFLILPQDKRLFEITKTTSFLFIRFNNIYLKVQQSGSIHNYPDGWIQKLEFIFQNNNNNYGCIIRYSEDKPLARALVEAIIQESVSQKFLYNELILQLINTLITLVARNISMHLYDNKDNSKTISVELLSYIHQNIYLPEKLKAVSIADHFNVSVNYIGEYFKKHTHENLQKYITNYRLSLAEIRLKHSDLRLNEIAGELGFTDDSHMNRLFRKYRGVNPSEYRKKERMEKLTA